MDRPNPMECRKPLWNLGKTVWNRMEENTYLHATPPNAPPKNPCKTLQKQSNLGIDRISWNPVKPCETLWKPYRIAFGRGWNCRKPYKTLLKATFPGAGVSQGAALEGSEVAQNLVKPMQKQQSRGGWSWARARLQRGELIETLTKPLWNQQNCDKAFWTVPAAGG